MVVSGVLRGSEMVKDGWLKVPPTQERWLDGGELLFGRFQPTVTGLYQRSQTGSQMPSTGSQSPIASRRPQTSFQRPLAGSLRPHTGFQRLHTLKSFHALTVRQLLPLQCEAIEWQLQWHCSSNMDKKLRSVKLQLICRGIELKVLPAQSQYGATAVPLQWHCSGTAVTAKSWT